MPKELVESLTISVETAAKLAGIGRSKAYEMCRDETFPGVINLDGRYVISKARFLAVINGNGSSSEGG